VQHDILSPIRLLNLANSDRRNIKSGNGSKTAYHYNAEFMSQKIYAVPNFLPNRAQQSLYRPKTL